MLWTKIAIARLSELETRKQGIANLAKQIEELNAQYEGIKTTRFDDMPRGGQSNREEVLIENIAAREELTRNQKYAISEVQMTLKGLEALTDIEREVLDAFYIHRSNNHVENLCKSLYIEKTRVYEIKNEAVKKFTMAMYGILEL